MLEGFFAYEKGLKNKAYKQKNKKAQPDPHDDRYVGVGNSQPKVQGTVQLRLRPEVDQKSTDHFALCARVEA